MKPGRILRTGDFVQRVLSESGKPAEQSSGAAFRDSGAIDKGVKNVLGGAARAARLLGVSTSGISKICTE